MGTSKHSNERESKRKGMTKKGGKQKNLSLEKSRTRSDSDTPLLHCTVLSLPQIDRCELAFTHNPSIQCACGKNRELADSDSKSLFHNSGAFFGGYLENLSNIELLAVFHV